MVLNEERIVATIENATRAFAELQGPGNKKKKDADLTSVVSSLLTLVSELFNSIRSLSVNATEQPISHTKQQIRSLEDEADENKQRSMRGNFVVTSQERDGKVCLIKTDKQLEEERMPLVNHVIELVKDKFDIDLPIQDIESCHRLQNKGIILRIWNKRPGSPCSEIVTAIKTGKNAEMNVYLNFQLTKRRNALLYEVRRLRRAGKIHKYFVNENGSMSIIVKEGEPKKRITYMETRNETVCTLKSNELPNLIEQ